MHFSSILFFVHIVTEGILASVDHLDDSKEYNFQLYSNDKMVFSNLDLGLNINSPSDYESWRRSVRTQNSFYQDTEPEGYIEIDYPKVSTAPNFPNFRDGLNALKSSQ